jgi:hypothetical protein
MSKQTFIFDGWWVLAFYYILHWESFELISKKLPHFPFFSPTPSISLREGYPEPPDCFCLQERAEGGDFNLLPCPGE